MKIIEETQAVFQNSPLSIDENFWQASSGIFKGGATKRRMKFFREARSVLEAAVASDEKILYVSPGTFFKFWEVYFGGAAVVQLINMNTIVLTDKRIVLIHTDMKGRPKSYANQIRHRELMEFKTRGLIGGFTAKMIDRKATFNMHRGDTKRFKELMPEIEAKPEKGLEHLCPACFSPQSRVLQCSQCGTEVKDPSKAARLSYFLPGLGDIYLGHKFFGFMELLGSIFLWLITFGVATFGFLEDGSFIPLIIMLVVIAIYNTTDSLLTRFQARKGLFSSDGKLPTRRVGERLQAGGQHAAVPVDSRHAPQKL